LFAAYCTVPVATLDPSLLGIIDIVFLLTSNTVSFVHSSIDQRAVQVVSFPDHSFHENLGKVKLPRAQTPAAPTAEAPWTTPATIEVPYPPIAALCKRLNRALTPQADWKAATREAIENSAGFII
jgi:hypothetical protein